MERTHLDDALAHTRAKRCCDFAPPKLYLGIRSEGKKDWRITRPVLR